jgi:F-type H+-transporting ATPase subunit c
MMLDLLPHLPALLAQVTPDAATATTATASVKSIGPTIALAGAGLGGALGVGMVGAKAAEAVGRNPGAFGQILTISIIGMALAEAIAIYALIVFFLYK